MFLFSSIDTIYSVKESLNKLMKHLNEQNEQTELESLIKLRNNAFLTKLNDPKIKSDDYNRILTQYERFVTTLNKCHESPDNAKTYIYGYLSDKNYYSVDPFITKPNPKMQAAAKTSATTAGLLLLASIPTFIINPLLGLAALTLAIATVIPALIHIASLNSDTLNHTKKLETDIFEQVAKANEANTTKPGLI